MAHPRTISFSTVEGLTHAGNPVDCFNTSALPSVHVTFVGRIP